MGLFFGLEMARLNAGAFWYDQRLVPTPTDGYLKMLQSFAKTGDAFHRSVFQRDGEQPAAARPPCQMQNWSFA